MRAPGRKGEIYEYFTCCWRQKHRCSQPHHCVEAVERAIEDEYANVQLSAERREKIRADVRAYVISLDQTAEPERQAIDESLKRLAAQEKKLLQVHYRDHISVELFGEEQTRLRRERVAAEKRRDEVNVDYGRMLERLDVALSLTDQIQAAYLAAGPALVASSTRPSSSASGSTVRPSPTSNWPRPSPSSMTRNLSIDQRTLAVRPRGPTTVSRTPRRVGWPAGAWTRVSGAAPRPEGDKAPRPLRTVELVTFYVWCG